MTTAANAAATTTTITSTTTTNALTTGLCPKRWELIACTSMTILCGMLRNLMRESGKMSLSPPSVKESKKPERIRFDTFPASQDMFENVAHRKRLCHTQNANGTLDMGCVVSNSCLVSRHAPEHTKPQAQTGVALL